MEIRSILELVVKAQEIHEESWEEEIGNYALTYDQAVDRVFEAYPSFNKPLDKEIAKFLIRNAYNEVQAWATME